MAKKITLVNSVKQATVDDDDFEYINQFTWIEENGYAITYDLGNEPIEMGWLVLNRHKSWLQG